jgi:hypothetical protein
MIGRPLTGGCHDNDAVPAARAGLDGAGMVSLAE